jgi:hypothetical protein
MKIKILFISILFLTVSYIFLANINFSLALNNAEKQFKDGLQSTGIEAGYPKEQTDKANLGDNNILKLVGEIVGYALAFLGVIFLFLIIYAGFMWMTARGNQQQIDKARDTLTAAIIGLVIVLLAYVIVNWFNQSIGAQLISS